MTNINMFYDALKSGKCIQFDYQGHPRIAEVHAVGTSKKGEQVIRVYQVGGGSRGEDAFGWKIMKIDGATSITILDQASHGPREGYKRDDRFMTEIIAQY